MKKFLPKAAIAVTAAGGLLLTSCGFGGSNESTDTGGGSGQNTTIELLVPSYAGGTKGRWEGIIEDFEAANEGINVDLEVQSWDNLASVVQTKVQGQQAPDILNTNSFTSFVNSDLLYPAEEVLSEETFNDFKESFAENASLNGAQYGMPLLASVRSMFYNKDLFDQAGIQSPPETWDELLSAATKVSNLGLAQTYGYGMPLGSEEAQAETAVFFYGGGGGYGDTSKIAIDTPENIEAAEFMQAMIEKGLTQPNPGSSNRTALMEVFMQGNIGMMMGLPQTVGKIEEKNPDLNYGIAPIPTQDGSAMTLGVADHLVAFKKDGGKQEAIQKFLDYFYSTDVYTNWVAAEGFLPTTISGAEAMAGNEDIQPFIDLLPAAVFYPANNPAWSATEAALRSLMGRLGQGVEPASLLEQIANKAEVAS